nr:cytochrome c biogenesis FN1, mitochondrial [Tanacetum cinerariifolium]
MVFLTAVTSSRNVAWYKEKAMSVEAPEARQILDEKQLAFLADPGIPAAVLMANISNYGSDVISEIPNSDNYMNDLDNQSGHALQDFEQSLVIDFTDNEISGTRGDRYDRYCIRIEEMRQSVRIIVQCPNQIPSGMIKVDDRKLCPPSRSRMKLSMESIPRLAHLVERGEALGTPISFFGAVSFPVPPPRHSALLLVLWKNQVTSPFFIDLGGKRNRLPVEKLDIKRTRGSVRGGASGFQCTASKIRTSLPADHCHPILDNGSNRPYRRKIRAPGSAHSQGLDSMSKHHMPADVVTIIGKRTHPLLHPVRDDKERASSIDEQQINGALGIALFFSPFLSASSDHFVQNFFVRTKPLAESNPVPQDPISTIHPPCIYAGVVASAMGFSLCRSKMMNGIVAFHSPPMRNDNAKKNGRLFRSAGYVRSRRTSKLFTLKFKHNERPRKERRMHQNAGAAPNTGGSFLLMIHKKGGKIRTYTLTMPHRLQPISLCYKVGQGKTPNFPLGASTAV